MTAGDTTPAIERGAAALHPGAFSEASDALARLMGVSPDGIEWSKDQARKNVREVLAAALDVEEMACAMCLSTICDGSKKSCPDYSVNVQRASAIRAAQLGEHA